MIERIRKSIPPKTIRKLWVKSGGRCEYRGCNIDLLTDSLTKRNINKAYISHIVSAKTNWTRGDKKRSKELEIEYNNLLLLCDECHNRIDKSERENHSEEYLVKMKQEHESRIENVTSIKLQMQSHIVTYSANINHHTPQLKFDSISEFLFPTHYPAIQHSIDLSLTNSLQRDIDKIFWRTELNNLVEQFDYQLKPRFKSGEIKHLSVFAFAPQPLLIKLGTLISDIQNVEIYQRIRKTEKWQWLNDVDDVNYIIKKPKKRDCKVALNISLSATIKNTRIHSVLGKDCSIYTLTIEEPFNDFLKTKKHLQDFSIEIRKLFNNIKAKYNGQTILHIFPAMPIAAAIEFGRIWMPKADMPLVIYDENTAKGEFLKAIEIKNRK